MAPASSVTTATTDSGLRDLFFRQRQASRTVRQTSAEERIAKLDKIQQEVESRSPEIQAALWEDFGKPAEEVMLTEVFPLLAEINHIRKNLKDWMAPRVVPASTAFSGAACQVRYEPRGVVLVISPWNYPFQLALGPFVSALAAGNCVTMKPSEFAPRTAQLVAEMVSAMFPDAEAAVVQGDKDIARALLELPFDHVFFTGSPAVGRKVMAAAARRLTSVTLELGGKSPAIIDRSARRRHAANRIAWGKFINAGQTCVAPDYVLVPEEDEAALVADLAQAVQRFYGGAAESLRNDDYCRLIHNRHLQRLSRLLEASIEAGARVAVGGQVDVQARKLAPTVLTGVTPDNPVMQEEIFGPILPLVRYRDLDEALEIVNGLPHPLALYLFSQDSARNEKILRKTISGDAVINDVVVHFSNSALPFGGVGNSGMGKAHGIYGFREFSHPRSILRQPRVSAIALLTPPYGRPWLRRLVDWTVKYFT